jgi:hypothetical protein
MEQTEGFEDPDFPAADYVLEILRGLYGRHSSGLERYDTFCNILIRYAWLYQIRNRSMYIR